MNFKYEEVRHNGDATTNYNITGDFPITFREFFKWVLDKEISFRIEFSASNKCYGGWLLGNRLEVSKHDDGKCYWTKQKPEKWFDEIADKKITACWANGGWGQMLYIVTFEENGGEKND